RARRFGIDARLAINHKNLITLGIGVEIEGYLGVLGQITQFIGIGAAVNQKGFGIPDKPDRSRLWHSVRANGGQPNNGFSLDPAHETRAKHFLTCWIVSWGQPL